MSPSRQLSVFWAVKFKEEVKGTNERRRVSWPFLWLIVSELGRCVYLSVTEQVDVLMVRTEHHVSQDRLPLHHSHRLIQQSVLGRRRDPIHADLERTQKEWRALKNPPVKTTRNANKLENHSGRSKRKLLFSISKENYVKPSVRISSINTEIFNMQKICLFFI